MVNLFIKDTRGNVAIIFSIVILALLAAVGAAVDFTSINAKRDNYQAMADAAVLAAARSGETAQGKLQTIADAFMDANNLTGQTLDSVLKLDNDGHVSVQVTGGHHMWFMGLFGKEYSDIQVIAQAPLSTAQSLNIALVLDVTGSMTGAKIKSLRTSANGLVTRIQDLNSNAIQMSVVPFARYVKLPASYANKKWLHLPNAQKPMWNGCVGTRAYPFNDQADYKNAKIPAVMSTECVSEIQPLTKNLTTVKTKISGLKASGWTYLPGGLAWGWRTLSPIAPLTQAVNNQKNAKNVMIVMTDGANTTFANPDGTHSIGPSGPADAVAAKLCDNIKDENIEIFSIAYDLDDVTAKDLLKSCASDESMFFDASNASDLEKVFQEIGNRLVKIRLTH